MWLCFPISEFDFRKSTCLLEYLLLPFVFAFAHTPFLVLFVFVYNNQDPGWFIFQDLFKYKISRWICYFILPIRVLLMIGYFECLRVIALAGTLAIVMVCRVKKCMHLITSVDKNFKSITLEKRLCLYKQFYIIFYLYLCRLGCSIATILLSFCFIGCTISISVILKAYRRIPGELAISFLLALLLVLLLTFITLNEIAEFPKNTNFLIKELRRRAKFEYSTAKSVSSRKISKVTMVLCKSLRIISFKYLNNSLVINTDFTAAFFNNLQDRIMEFILLF